MIVAGVVQFSVAMAVVQAKYPGYSDAANYISDLGNTALSPWYLRFNVSIVLLGVLAFVGILLGWGGFLPGGTRALGLLLLRVASAGAVGVGVFPENVNPTVHGVASLIVFAPGGGALLLLGAGMRRGTGWHGLGGLSLLLGLITLVSLAYYVPTQSSNTTVDPGRIERLVVFPILIWGFLAGVQLGRPRRASRFFPGTIA
ncbi:MAG: DUF998 domain-containing protein [Thermoplasmata archaeon]